MNLFPVLENKRVLLRPLEKSDAALLFPRIASEPELFRFMTLQIKTEADLDRFIATALEERAQQKSIPFLVLDKQGDKVAGTTRFDNIVEQHKRVEIGWTFLASAFHGTGLNKAMKYLMLDYAFNVLGMNRVEMKANELNVPSRRAIEHLGATFEGVLRHHMINEDGSVRNSVYYSIIKEEWPEIRERIFKKYIEIW